MSEISADYTTRHHAGRDGFDRLQAARDEIVAAIDGYLICEAITASLTARRTSRDVARDDPPATLDNRLKQFFTSGEIKYRDVPFQGEGIPVARSGSDLRGRLFA